MTICFVYGCNHRSDRSSEKCSFRRFPTNTDLLQRWIDATRRSDTRPSLHSRICECHFEAEDIVPSIFPWNLKKKFDFKSPEKKKRRKNHRTSAQHEDEESDRSMVEMLEEITSLRNNFKELKNENENLQIQLSGFTAIQNEVDELRKVNENLRLQIAGFTAIQNEVEELRKANENLSLQITGFTVVQNKVEELREENKNFRAQISNLASVKIELEKMRTEKENFIPQNFFSTVMQKDVLIEHYTGISRKSFDVIHELLIDVQNEKRVVKIPEKHQLLLTFVKLRHNSTHIDLGIRFGICKSTVSKILSIYITKLHSVIFKCIMGTVPSRFKNSLCLPKCFDTFQNCRMIIDCTEVPCDIPGNMDQQKKTYSSYKHRNTFKVLIGCSPNGACTFCSDLYPGSTSDRAIVEHCDILKIFETGDLVLADKGFTITDLLPEGVSLNIPPFLNTPQFSEDEIYETTRTAQARIHIERVINRVKKFRITRHIPASLFDIANEIVQVCVALVNFQNSIIQTTDRCKSLMEKLTIEDIDEET